MLLPPCIIHIFSNVIAQFSGPPKVRSSLWMIMLWNEMASGGGHQTGVSSLSTGPQVTSCPCETSHCYLSSLTTNASQRHQLHSQSSTAPKKEKRDNKRVCLTGSMQRVSCFRHQPILTFPNSLLMDEPQTGPMDIECKVWAVFVCHKLSMVGCIE